MRYARTGALLGAVCIATLISSGCEKTENKAKKTPTQVVAKVDSEEISVHQLNSVLSKNPGIPTEHLGEAKWEILNKLIDQQIAVNQAVEKRLDRKPEVVMAIESAKREILARAFLQELAATQVKPTTDEVRTYYAEHPELFSLRRVYKLQELILQKNDELVPALQSKVASSKNLEEVAAWLKERKVAFKADGGVRAAEQLPLDVLPKVHSLKDGQIALIPSAKGTAIVRLVGSETQPVTESQAAPRIQAFLANQRTTEAVQREMKALKEKTKIEYFGEFAGGVPPKPVENVTAVAPAPAKRSSVADNPPPPPQVVTPRAESVTKIAETPTADKTTIERGVAGLK